LKLDLKREALLNKWFGDGILFLGLAFTAGTAFLALAGAALVLVVLVLVAFAVSVFFALGLVVEEVVVDAAAALTAIERIGCWAAKGRAWVRTERKAESIEMTMERGGRKD